MRPFSGIQRDFASCATDGMREEMRNQNGESLVVDPRSQVRPVESVEQKLQVALRSDRSRSCPGNVAQ